MNHPIDSFIRQITSYNLFNYLLPGTLFCFLMSTMFGYPFIVDNLFVAFFAYYFVGLVISRIGSLIIEPVFKTLKLFKYAPYKDFLTAAASDAKIDVLSEQNNVYRTLTSLPICMLVFLVASRLSEIGEFPLLFQKIGLLVAIFVLFVFSFRKQSKYVIERVEVANSTEKGTPNPPR